MSIIVLDFDGTITQNDTIDVLGKFACSRNGGAVIWNDIVKAYFADHKSHVATYQPEPALRKTLDQELAFLESLRPVELASAERVVHAALFRDLTDSDFERFGREAFGNGLRGDRELGGGGVSSPSPPEVTPAVTLRSGFRAFVDEVASRKDSSLGLVSVNWSQSFIEGVLGGEGEDRGGRFIKRVNRITSPTGLIEGPAELAGATLVTAQDKLDALRELLSQDQADGQKQKRQTCVYIGDSTTDLACLMEASIGIVMADNEDSKLLQTLARLGYDVPHVSAWKAPAQLAWARDFDEILQSKIIDPVRDMP
ncbi:haloacid dehalogenase-like hydrolase-domain-containing protein [Podospora appendiculata]|uniref:Haloacid dehalogenase-like hydrolase-domain-containing protein n=1 Tax=Podospora appendiculata TaxID=314037 RepID=A0AAE1CHX8_9PEZI|nr:haloacid dehalogenase-like hydrolase-domain-containing protein [Podospora appendiculata]